MKRYVEGENRSQSMLFPESLDDYIAEDNAVRVVDVFVDELDLREIGFEGAEPEATGRPAYHPGTLLRLRGVSVEAALLSAHARTHDRAQRS